MSAAVSFRGGEVPVPVAVDLDVIAVRDGVAALRHGADVGEHRAFVIADDVEILPGGFGVPRCGYAQRKQRLDLGGEEDAIGRDGVEQRLDAEAVADGDHGLPPLVGDQHGELAAQLFRRAQAVLQVEVQGDLAVGLRLEPAAFGAEFVADGFVAVELAVDRKMHVAFGVRHRLVAIAEADDREAGVAEEEAPVAPLALAVGPAMIEAVQRRLDAFTRKRLAGDAADQSAHGRFP